ncbi:hypothetical protein DICPUDRAFT_96898 [Dictyostelium purpureum]|uniref:Homeobox domain-containing protein n=1 Tax=Dictyostelium purpureum TaxID=5786 RepID=F0ZC45_DICPU|nr:uncharacterized protein DICPUDRAFT_96898 [Dictyostelium purpureum]EGC38524.1 hypothetical protein DICPUDRAFT_96898 [Dictyostelium purpureum]|eukprot:XP_003284989.1 hypothetical protein DICPUDRAFT_96898 [Dictyostelium purpureum]
MTSLANRSQLMYLNQQSMYHNSNNNTPPPMKQGQQHNVDRDDYDSYDQPYYNNSPQQYSNNNNNSNNSNNNNNNGYNQHPHYNQQQYHHHQYNNQSSPQSQYNSSQTSLSKLLSRSNDMIIENQDDPSKKKRKRTSPDQLKLLEKIFLAHQHPNLNLRSQLAVELQMTARSVQIWFQNRRAKARNMEFKPQPNHGGSDLIYSALGGSPGGYSSQRNINKYSGIGSSGEKFSVASAWNRILLQPNNVDFLIRYNPDDPTSIDVNARYSIDVDDMDNQGYTPLYLAAKAGKQNFVKYLLSKGASKKLALEKLIQENQDKEIIQILESTKVNTNNNINNNENINNNSFENNNNNNSNNNSNSNNINNNINSNSSNSSSNNIHSKIIDDDDDYYDRVYKKSYTNKIISNSFTYNQQKPNIYDD